LVFTPLTGTKIHQKFRFSDTKVRFSPLERQYIGAYLFSFDDSSVMNRLGDMEHQRTKYELFLTKPILVKCLWHICNQMNLQPVFTELLNGTRRMSFIKEFVGKLLVRQRRPFL